MIADQRDFYLSLPVFSDFAEVVRAESFSPLPDESFVGFTDVTGSTAAIAAGRYKAVNMLVPVPSRPSQIRSDGDLSLLPLEETA